MPHVLVPSRPLVTSNVVRMTCPLPAESTSNDPSPRPAAGFSAQYSRSPGRGTAALPAAAGVPRGGGGGEGRGAHGRVGGGEGREAGGGGKGRRGERREAAGEGPGPADVVDQQHAAGLDERLHRGQFLRRRRVRGRAGQVGKRGRPRRQVLPR